MAPWKWSLGLYGLRSIENTVECERFVRLVWGVGGE
jgi:peptidyl-tRNA hydrolase